MQCVGEQNGVGTKRMRNGKYDIVGQRLRNVQQVNTK